MTVEELNIKISADAENFKNAVAEANASIQKFKDDAVSAGSEVTKAFNGLLGVELQINTNEVTSDTRNAVNTADVTDTSGRRDSNTGIFSRIFRAETAAADDADKPSVSGFLSFLQNKTNSSQETVNVLSLNDNETVIGAVSGNDSSSGTPLNITTTVELDGDKLGESVDRFFMRRNKMTNGSGG